MVINMENWMQYVPKCHLDKEGNIKDDYYFPYWFRCQDFFHCKGDFKKMHEALLKFEKYCQAHSDEMVNIRFYNEIEAMVYSVGIKQKKNFAVCHQDDYFGYFSKKEPEYCFCWDAGNIVWKFPDGYSGNIWI